MPHNIESVVVLVVALLTMGVAAWVTGRIWKAALSLLMNQFRVTLAVEEVLFGKAMKKLRSKKQSQAAEAPMEPHDPHKFDEDVSLPISVRPALDAKTLGLIREVFRREAESKQASKKARLAPDVASRASISVGHSAACQPAEAVVDLSDKPYNPIATNEDFFIQRKTPDGRVVLTRKGTITATPKSAPIDTDPTSRAAIRDVVRKVMEEALTKDQEPQLSDPERETTSNLPEDVPADWDSPMLRFYRKRLGGKLPAYDSQRPESVVQKFGTAPTFKGPDALTQKWLPLLAGIVEDPAKRACAAVLEFEAKLMLELPEALRQVAFATFAQEDMGWFTSEIPEAANDADVIVLNCGSGFARWADCSGHINGRIIGHAHDPVTIRLAKPAADADTLNIPRCDIARVDAGAGLLRYVFPVIRRRFGKLFRDIVQTDDVTMVAGRPKWQQPLMTAIRPKSPRGAQLRG